MIGTGVGGTAGTSDNLQAGMKQDEELAASTASNNRPTHPKRKSPDTFRPVPTSTLTQASHTHNRLMTAMAKTTTPEPVQITKDEWARQNPNTPPPRSTVSITMTGDGTYYAANRRDAFTHKLMTCCVCKSRSWRKLSASRQPNKWRSLSKAGYVLLTNWHYCPRCSHLADQTNEELEELLTRTALEFVQSLQKLPRSRQSR